MAKKDRVTDLRQKSRFAAMEGLKPKGGFPVPPRKAMKEAKKASKKLPYPLPPYPSSNPLQLAQWVRYEWWQLGRWQRVVAPVVILAALLTWEKEKALQEARWHELDNVQTKRKATEIYGAFGPAPKPRGKLLGFIPLPGRK